MPIDGNPAGWDDVCFQQRGIHPVETAQQRNADGKLSERPITVGAGKMFVDADIDGPAFQKVAKGNRMRLEIADEIAVGSLSVFIR